MSQEKHVSDKLLLIELVEYFYAHQDLTFWEVISEFKKLKKVENTD